MRTGRHIVLLTLLLAGVVSGCASRQCCPPTDATFTFACEPTQRRPFLLDLSLVGGQLAGEPARNYCNLPEREAQCLAASNSPTARMLEYDADVLETQSGGWLHPGRSNAAAAEVLRLRAAHERNLAAAAALSLLYKLAEAESGADHLVQSLQIVNAMLGDVRRLQSAGLPAPSGQAQLEAERLITERRLVELQVTIDELNEQLATIVGAELPPNSRFWPDLDLRVDPAIPIVEEAVSLAMVQRGDVAAARLATTLSDGEILRAAGALVGSSAGIGSGVLRCLHRGRALAEADLRREQLQIAAADEQRSVHVEVSRSVNVLRARLQQIGLSQQRVEVQRQRLAQSGAKEQFEPGASFESHTARLDFLQAGQDLFHDVIEWKIALAKVREAQGELAIECGYDAALRSNACCIDE